MISRRCFIGTTLGTGVALAAQGVQTTAASPAGRRVIVDAYGPERCYWGTDMTNGFAKATYRLRITHFTEELDFLSEDDKDWVIGRAILASLKWA
jgi:hypothetical protein